MAYDVRARHAALRDARGLAPYTDDADVDRLLSALSECVNA